ncbi:ATP-grasp domain-containing protein [Penaeicola halotolerans]|uniref:ATP-grasp domain-containing protein n=1 Tax=Penaeicola halotolerans TaxID=2793196 RepID=UPI001CF8120F|nr:hypothetical protein [Penaeicola halotolerans]
MKIALITCPDLLNYNDNVESEDELLYKFLTTKGASVTFEIWSDPNVLWGQYDLLVVKSPWDYFDRYAEFTAWLASMKSAGYPMVNSVDIIQWNADKHYLSEIEAAGFDIVPSVWVEKGEEIDLSTFFGRFDTDQLIVKPCVSGGAKHTYKLNRELAVAKQVEIQALIMEESFLIQPFVEEIASEGEWSMIYFGGQFSHSVLKTAKPGDFRVQHFLGGTIHTPALPAEIRAYGDALMTQFGQETLYARVDGVRRKDGSFQLMELELIEPFLFLFTHTDAKENYWQALQQIHSSLTKQ